MPRKHSIQFTEPSLTQQHSKAECDINNIMARYQKTGIIDHVAKHAPTYRDHNGDDYHTSMTIVANANSMFADLPSQARRHFNNDPAQFLDFVQDESNHSQLHELGLAKHALKSPPSDEPSPAPAPVQPTNTPSEQAPAAPTPAE